MKTIARLFLCVPAAVLVFSICCAERKSMIGEPDRYKKPGTYNFKFTGYDFNISGPEEDRRSYYRIFIDKIEAGRTTIGLESQQKAFEMIIAPNRHLLTVEKWVLDEKMEKYVKLNNIDQPKPEFVYFEIPGDRIAIIVLKNDASVNRAVFEVEYESE